MQQRTIVQLALFMVVSGALHAQENEWPKEYSAETGSIILYQPQVEQFDGNELEARAAVAVKLHSQNDVPVFGAVWLIARIDTDRNSRTVTVRDIKISDVRFADATDERKEMLAEFLEKEIQGSAYTMALDQLLTALEVDVEDIEGFKHDAPVIVLSTEAAVLVLIDGDPSFQEIDGSTLERVVNTPYLIVKDETRFYLSGGGDLWYGSSSALGPWTVTGNVPAQIAQLAEPEQDESADTEGEPPRIIVATEPTELIVSAADPTWSPIESMGLLYMDNTDSNVFLELSTQKYYVLLSGRWYRGTAIDEEWEHVPSDQLPEVFSKIEEDSINGSVLSQIAGTQQARDAVLDHSIPQTAAISRNDSSVSVSYDGEPEFDDIENIQVQYAVNTPSSVFRVGNLYFACVEGVWYQSSSATGPWAVSTSVPDIIYDIPPSNPHYNVTYVRVYDVTPEVVYVGYTPGYVNSYYYHGTVIYGTGWYYRPWYGPYYYPRPSTWGFHVQYNPWTGWNFGVSWRNGPFTFHFGTAGYGGWFGVGGYRPYYRPYVGIGYRKTNINIDRNININTGDVNIGGGRPRDRENLYSRPENRSRNIVRPQVVDQQRSRIVRNGQNNVYADRDGDVYRRNSDGKWQQRDSGEWKQATNLDSGALSNRTLSSTGANRSRTLTTTDNRAPSGNYSATRPSLERSHNARQRGSQRSQQFQRQGGGRRSR